MWKWVLKAAIYAGKSEWARAAAKKVIERLRRRLDRKLQAVADAAGIAVPPVDEIRQGRIVRARSDIFKPGQVVLVAGERFRISRLLSHSATETVYEADPLP
jgi:hypothetical protein